MKNGILRIVCIALAIIGGIAWLNRSGVHLFPAWRESGLDTWIAGISLTALAVIILGWTFAQPSRRRTDTRPRPDTPIRDLFLDLDPSLVSPEAGQGSDLGPRILRALRDGSLHSWARDVGLSGPLRPLEPAYWQDSDFTYWFLREGADPRSTVHAGRPDGTAQVRDIHVYSAEVSLLFTKP